MIVVVGGEIDIGIFNRKYFGREDRGLGREVNGAKGEL